MKIIVKTKFFKPIVFSDNNFNILLYELIDEKWFENTIRSRRELLDELLAVAQNTISLIESSGELRDKYVYVEVEYPGLKASRGDGRVENVETIVFPIPMPLKTIVFYKRSNGELIEVNRIDFKQEKWIYDSFIKSTEVDFDAILVESIENKRVILREELILPHSIRVTSGVEGEKKRSRRRRRRAKKTSQRRKQKRRKSKTRSGRSKRVSK
uniref:Uncharacterized protein n=1 Tax=Staphylothermus marinus TaxID=2280 RepID=A0A7C4D9J9_STAMA